jgi:F-type H+-transporting ATPase subunit delta
MAELITIARPYARAAFEQARSEPDGLARWSDMLALLAGIASDDRVQAALASPALDSERKVALFLEIAGDQLDKTGSNFVKLLGSNDRLEVLPDIAEVYEELRSEAEKTVEAELVSAFEVSDKERDQVAAALSRRLGREVSLSCRVDESLLGGAVIRAGDLVIDGSARSKLNKLSAALRQ